MGARVLLVDSSSTDARRMKARLVPGRFHFADSETGKDALEIAADWRPDVVLISHPLTDLNGEDVCRRLKADPATANALVVMVAPRLEPARELSELGIGADDFLTQPDELKVLPRRLRRLARFKHARDEYWARAATARTLEPDLAPAPAPTFAGSHALIALESGAETALVEDWLAHDTIQGTPGADDRGQAGEDFDLILFDRAVLEPARGTPPSWLREDRRTKHVRLLFVGDESDAQSIAGYGGAGDWLARPLSEARLRARARTQILHERYRRSLRDGRAVEHAHADASSGLFDTAYGQIHLRQLLARAPASDLAVLRIEIDQLDRIREGDGDVRGDRALGAVATALRRNLRVFDTLARADHAGFLVLMPGAAPAEALNVGERLRDAIATTSFSADGGSDPPRLTVSVGIAAGTGASVNAETLIAYAESALRRAARAGRNRVELAQKNLGTPRTLAPTSRS